MHSIYYKDRVFHFTTSAPEGANVLVCDDSKEPLAPAKLVEKVENSKSLYIIHPKPHKTYKRFCKQFKTVKAGGGLVRSDSGRLLMILRNGWWDLPKGHLECGETIEECAIREVEEECGVHDITITAPITVTKHFHRAYGKWEIKKSYWFLMRSATDQSTTAQAEEKITRVEWLEGEELDEAVASSYTTIQGVFAAFYNNNEETK